jgi:hypothetical protein
MLRIQQTYRQTTQHRATRRKHAHARRARRPTARTRTTTQLQEERGSEDTQTNRQNKTARARTTTRVNDGHRMVARRFVTPPSREGLGMSVRLFISSADVEVRRTPTRRRRLEDEDAR